MRQSCYAPLSEKPNRIRLLQLLPSQVDPENVRCRLMEYTLRESDATNHPYEALSYVWGDNDKPQYIFVDDQELSVTPNLYTALLRLRDYELPRILWVDAICIDQASKEEKAQQIQFMAAIYAKASRVIVWLGEAHDDSDWALGAALIASNKSMEPTSRERFEQAMLQLLKRPWFRRIWVRKQKNVQCQ